MSVAVLSDISTGQPTIDSTSVLLLVIETSCWSVPSVDSPQIHDPRNEETSNDTRNLSKIISIPFSMMVKSASVIFILK